MADYIPTTFTDNVGPGVGQTELAKLGNGVQDAIRAWKTGTKAQMVAQDMTASRYWAWFTSDGGETYVNFDGANWTKISAGGWAYDSEVSGQSFVDLASLNGDSDIEYELILDGQVTTGGVARNITARPNNIVLNTFSLYGQYVRPTAAPSSGPYDGGGFLIGYTYAADTLIASRGIFFAKSGRTRRWLGNCLATSTTGNQLVIDSGGRWDDTATVVNSLRVDFGGGTFTGRIRLRKV